MTTVEVHDESPAEQHGHATEGGIHGPKTTLYYVRIAVILAFITALESSTYWIDFGKLFLPMLFVLMTIKFFMVVLYFMHLKFDNKMFGYLFYSGLGLAVFVYVAALCTFRIFDTP